MPARDDPFVPVTTPAPAAATKGLAVPVIPPIPPADRDPLVPVRNEFDRPARKEIPFCNLLHESRRMRLDYEIVF